MSRRNNKHKDPLLTNDFQSGASELSEAGSGSHERIAGDVDFNDVLLAEDQKGHGTKVGLENEAESFWTYFFRPAIVGKFYEKKDLQNMAGLTKGNIFSYNTHALHSFGWIPVVLSGALWR
jgi:hypothetical protein